jgi:hypothetical protein
VEKMNLENYFTGNTPVSVLIGDVWVLVDREDVPSIVYFPWSKSGAGLKKGKQYIQGQVVNRGPIVYLHRFLNKTPKGMLTDHIDNNALNNRKSNLRSVTVSQNNMNSKLKKENTSGYRGVTYRKDTGKWMAQINKGGRHYCLGSFLTKEAAFAVYLEKTKELFGEFARYNNGEISEWVKKQ